MNSHNFIQNLKNLSSSTPSFDILSKIATALDSGCCSQSIIKTLKNLEEISVKENCLWFAIGVQALFSSYYTSMSLSLKSLEHLRNWEILLEASLENADESQIASLRYSHAILQTRRAEDLSKLELFSISASELQSAEENFKFCGGQETEDYIYLLVSKAILSINGSLNLEQASTYLDQAEALFHSLNSQDTTLYAQITRWRGWRCLINKQFEKAGVLAEKAQNLFSRGNSSLNAIRMNLLKAEILFCSSQFESCKELVLESLSLLHHHHRHHHFDTSDFFSLLARIYSASKASIEEIWTIFVQAEVHITKATSGKTHPKAAKLALTKAKCFESAGLLEEAFECAKYSVDCYQSCIGTEQTLQIASALHFTQNLVSKINKTRDLKLAECDILTMSSCSGSPVRS